MSCEHSNQKSVNGAWVCRSCGETMPEVRGVKSKEDFLSIRLGNKENLKQFREMGITERQFTKKNIEEFRKNKGYDPVRVDGKDRWI